MQPFCPVGETPTCSPDKFEWLWRDRGPNLAREATPRMEIKDVRFSSFVRPAAAR
jgi:hypothetical protein